MTHHIHSWLALKTVPGVGNHLYKRLMKAFGEPVDVFRAKKSDLMAVDGVSSRVADAISGFRFPDAIDQEIDLAQQAGVRIIAFSHPEYPALLRHITDPPPYLYVKGHLDHTEKSIAMVGSRSASSYGITMARRLSRDLAARGLPIVSGMARGVDSAAHEGAIAAGGYTYAILGSGLGVIYPPENRKLFYKIAECGAVISEFPMMEAPNSYNFPARNRIIAGMSLGTIVVEAARKSGSLITARLAAEQNREVFAVPGNINSAKSTGAHNLLKQGAKLVACAQDVIEEFYQLQDVPVQNSPVQNVPVPETPDKGLPPQSPEISNASSAKNPNLAGPGRENLTNEESLVYDSLDAYPMHIDALSRKTGLNVGRLSVVLLNLELKEMIVQSPGKYFNLA